MGRIETPQRLWEVLPGVRRESRGSLEGEGQSLLFQPPSIDGRNLVRIVVSEINRGAFRAYEEGHLQLDGFHSFDELGSLPDQEAWVVKAASRDLLWFRIYEGQDLSDATTAVFNYGTATAAKGPVLSVRTLHSGFSPEWVRKMITPFIPPDRIEEMVDGIGRSSGYRLTRRPAYQLSP